MPLMESFIGVNIVNADRLVQMCDGLVCPFAAVQLRLSIAFAFGPSGDELGNVWVSYVIYVVRHVVVAEDPKGLGVEWGVGYGQAPLDPQAIEYRYETVTESQRKGGGKNSKHWCRLGARGMGTKLGDHENCQKRGVDLEKATDEMKFPQKHSDCRYDVLHTPLAHHGQLVLAITKNGYNQGT
ncbi:hypothetical protein L210DRAFT_3504524 [Boletus edulis BED1]|uniref:Uncharacterized protein n=1 Tax=Boletus edulis BED1 TaxID=1328754 RepID=A0AAD4GDW2_BOLED|nr:hypothetical protein L210DRAFT_3504524 [Boletus edulis BED1]